MTKQSATFFVLTLATQTLLASLSTANPIPTETHEHVLDGRGFNGACGYPYAGYGTCDYPDYGCAGLGSCGAFGYPYSGIGKYNGYGGCGECGIGACAAPCLTNCDKTCTDADQCCHNVAYENCDHVACNVCKDCDTAYCANNDKCCKDNKLNCFNVINKAKRSADTGTLIKVEKRCESLHGFGCGHSCGLGECGSPCGLGECGYPCGLGECGYPCGFGECGLPCGLGEYGLPCGLGECRLPCRSGGIGYGYGSADCFKKRDFTKQKRGGIPYGYGNPYGYGAFYGGACAPSVVSSNAICNSGDQCCHNVAYENCKHVACNVCEDCDTAYCANKDACSNDHAANCFSSV